jgi:hypothetical protein
MEAFCRKHEARIAGVLSCFDRMLFRGYLPIMSGASMAQFLRSEQVNCGDLKQFLVETGQRLKGYAERMAARAGRPFECLGHAGVRLAADSNARRLAPPPIAPARFAACTPFAPRADPSPPDR